MPSFWAEWGENAFAWSGYAAMNFFSDKLIVNFDNETKSLLISHPDVQEFPYPLVTLREETYSSMSFDEFAAFLGARLLLLMPAMREQFETQIEKRANSEFGESCKIKGAGPTFNK